MAKENALVKCLKIKNENPDFSQKADNFKRLKIEKPKLDSRAQLLRAK